MRFQLATIITAISAVVAGVSAAQVNSVDLAQRQALYERWLDSQAAEMVERSLERRTPEAPPLSKIIADNLHHILAQHELLVDGRICKVNGPAKQNQHGEWVIPCDNSHKVVVNGATKMWKWEHNPWIPLPLFGGSHI